MNDKISKEQFEQWLNSSATLAILDIMRQYRHNYVSALSNGETVFHESDKTQAETARAIGVIYGIDLLLEIKYEDTND